MRVLLSVILRPFRFVSVIFKKWTLRGNRFYIYMKSGNVVEIDALSIDCEILDGQYSSIQWCCAGLPNRELLTLDVSQVEAIVMKNW